MFDVKQELPKAPLYREEFEQITAVSEPVSIFTERKAALPLIMR